MKRRLLMVLFTVIGVFALENLVDLLITRYAPMQGELIIWGVLSALAGLVVWEVGEDRGDW